MRKFVNVLLCALLVLTGCESKVIQKPEIKGYKVVGISDVNMGQGSLSATLQVNLDIDNPATVAYSIDALTAVVYNESAVKFADASLKSPAVADAGFSGIVPVYLNVKFSNPLAIISSGILNGKGFDMEKYTADVDAVVKIGPISRNIRKEGIPVSDIINIIKSL